SAHAGSAGQFSSAAGATGKHLSNAGPTTKATCGTKEDSRFRPDTKKSKTFGAKGRRRGYRNFQPFYGSCRILPRYGWLDRFGGLQSVPLARRADRGDGGVQAKGGHSGGH